MNHAVNSRSRDARQRWRVLRGLERWLQTPLMVLSFVWLLLVVLELARGTSRALEVFGTAIWIVFIVEFTLRLLLAPSKRAFMARNWITVIALLAPALRLLYVFRLLRLAPAARGFRLVRIVGTANCGMNALRASLSRRGLGYVIVLTILIALLGAGGMFAFEPASQVQGGFGSYVDALWWTGMLLTTMGTDFWPTTAEGRILTFLMALYGFGVFGYITASFASFFVERDASSPKANTVSTADVARLRSEILAMRLELAGGRTARSGE